MSTRRKYMPGDRIESLDELTQQNYVYIFGKHSRGIRNISVVECMTLRTVMGFMQRGIYKAIPFEEEVKLCLHNKK